MGWTREAVLVAVLVLWVVVRLALRRPLAHPWFVAFAIAAAGAALADGTSLLAGLAAYAGRALALACGLGAVAVFVDALRRASGAPRLPRTGLAAALAGIALAALCCAALPARQGSLLGGIVGAAVLLNAVAPLVRSARHPLGAFTVAAGIVVYAVGRSAITLAHALGRDERGLQLEADVAAIAVLGLGLLLAAAEGGRAERAGVAVAVGARSDAA